MQEIALTDTENDSSYVDVTTAQHWSRSEDRGVVSHCGTKLTLP